MASPDRLLPNFPEDDGGGHNPHSLPLSRSPRGAMSEPVVESVRAPAIKKGWMTKQGRGGLVKNWKKRYFVLMAGKIQYYVNETKEFPYGEVMKGEMSLVNTEVSGEDRQNPAQIFVASFNGENSMLMEAASSEEAAEWRVALKHHVKFANIATEETVSRVSRRVVEAKPAEAMASSVESSGPTKTATAAAAEEESKLTEPDRTPDEAFMLLFDKFLAFGLDAPRRAEMIASFLPTAQSVVGSLVENVQVGEAGQRGEELLVPAVCLVAVVTFGFIPKLAFLITLLLKLFGVVLVVVGFMMVLNACWELNDKLSPWLQPTKATTKIVTGGVYGIVRHPMYGGLILFCFGLAMLQQHVYKCFATIALSVFLNKAAEIEEEALERAFPKDYPTYCNHRKAFVPFLY